MHDHLGDEESDEHDLVIVNMQIEFYLKQRDEPLQVYMAVGVPLSIFQNHGIMTGIWALMDEASENLISEMDSKGSAYLFVTDKRMNRMIIMSDEIQSVSILTPDKSTIEATMEEMSSE